MPEPVVFTVGHSTRAPEVFLRLLRGAGVRLLVDVRTAPSSRRWPWFGREALAAALEQAGIGYRWAPELGGFRKARPDSPHVALTSPGFRGYADHMGTAEFRAALERLVGWARERPTAVMCAEGLWWRCHRRLLADALTAAGCEVRHLVRAGEVEAHRMHPAARLDEDGRLVYDVGAQPALSAEETGAERRPRRPRS